jgi:transcriptional regulator with XRE-family HTH domain
MRIRAGNRVGRVMDNSFSFGVWLRQRRMALGLTHKQLAAAVGCAVVMLRKIEADERRPSQQLAELLAARLELLDALRPLFVQVARGVLAVDHLPAPLPSADGAPAQAPSVAPAAVALPAGTVTFLFSDLAGSEQQFQTTPPALARLEALLRQAVAAQAALGEAAFAAAWAAGQALTPEQAVEEALGDDDEGAPAHSTSSEQIGLL